MLPRMRGPPATERPLYRENSDIGQALSNGGDYCVVARRMPACQSFDSPPRSYAISVELQRVASAETLRQRLDEVAPALHRLTKRQRAFAGRPDTH